MCVAEPEGAADPGVRGQDQPLPHCQQQQEELHQQQHSRVRYTQHLQYSNSIAESGTPNTSTVQQQHFQNMYQKKDDGNSNSK